MTLKKPKMVYPDFTSEASLGFFISDALIIGVDEVGRGCLAGPVVAAAAVVPKEKALEIGFSKKGARPTAGSEKSRSEIELHSFLQVKDSKLIPEKIRHALVSALDDQGVIHSIAEASVTEIAKLNILYASHLAMERAVAGV